MNTTFDILVIALSCLLGVFLILSIVAITLVVKLVAELRKIVAKADELVDSAEAIGETLRQHASAVNIVRLLANLVGSFSGAKRRKG